MQSAKPQGRLPFESTLIAKELQEIERFRAKQQRELDALLENERLLEQIRRRNIEREIVEKRRKERQDPRSAEFSYRLDLKKRRDDEHRRSVYLRDQMLQQQKKATHDVRDEMLARKAEEEASWKRAQEKEDELSRKERRLKFEEETAARFAWQEARIEKKRVEVESRQRQANTLMEEQR